MAAGPIAGDALAYGAELGFGEERQAFPASSAEVDEAGLDDGERPGTMYRCGGEFAFRFMWQEETRR